MLISNYPSAAGTNLRRFETPGDHPQRVQIRKRLRGHSAISCQAKYREYRWKHLIYSQIYRRTTNQIISIEHQTGDSREGSQLFRLMDLMRHICIIRQKKWSFSISNPLQQRDEKDHLPIIFFAIPVPCVIKNINIYYLDMI